MGVRDVVRREFSDVLVVPALGVCDLRDRPEVDVAEDRSVIIRIIALPGDAPLPDDIIAGPVGVASEECGW